MPQNTGIMKASDIPPEVRRKVLQLEAALATSCGSPDLARYLRHRAQRVKEKAEKDGTWGTMRQIVYSTPEDLRRAATTDEYTWKAKVIDRSDDSPLPSLEKFDEARRRAKE